MANIFMLNQKQAYLVALLENDDILTKEERSDLQAALNDIIVKKGNALPELFDIKEYLAIQNNAAREKVSEIQALIKKNDGVLKRIDEYAKLIFTSTGQMLYSIGTVIFKRHELPRRVEILDASIVPDEFKRISIKVPLYAAKLIAIEYPELNLEIDEDSAVISKTEIKKLADEGIIVQGTKIVDDDFKVEVKGISDGKTVQGS
jgi:hypothetical protein